MQPRNAAPIVLWGEEAARFLFALIAPLKYVPGRRDRWYAVMEARPITSCEIAVAMSAGTTNPGRPVDSATNTTPVIGVR